MPVPVPPAVMSLKPDCFSPLWEAESTGVVQPRERTMEGSLLPAAALQGAGDARLRVFLEGPRGRTNVRASDAPG